jgi:hypothetical protein
MMISTLVDPQRTGALLDVLRSRRELIKALIILCWGSALCFIPLFNLLSFEFSFLCCIPVSFCAADLGIQRYRSTLDPLDPKRPAWGAWGGASVQGAALALIPLIPICLNGLRVRNCNWLEGALFYLILPMVTVVVAAGWGVCLGRIRRGLGSFTLLFLGMILVAGVRFWTTPIIDFFTPFMGYYPGSLYDEEISIGWRLLWSRGEDLLWVAFCLSVLDIIHDHRDVMRRVWGSLMLFLILVFYVGGAHFDLRRSASHIQSRLGGHLSTEHFEMYFPRGWSAQRAAKLSVDLEFQYRELSRFFDLQVPRKIGAYFYRHSRQKKRLMGAGQTLIAKPWQYALHIHAPQVGDRVIAHELSHVFSAEIADAPHHLSLYRGVLPHMSLIEGLAVAATWSRGRLDPHQWSAALDQLGVAPPLRDVLSPNGFYLRSSRVAYTLCGSFVRFYRQERGQAPLHQLYRLGSFPGGEAELEATIDRWTTFIKEIPLSAQALHFAEGLFHRPSIFYKVCAHEVASRRRLARGAMSESAWEMALAHWDELLSDSPKDGEAHLGRVQSLYMLKHPKEAQSVALTLAKDEAQSAPTRQRALEWVEDLKMLTEEPPQTSRYPQLLDEVFGRPQMRRLAVKFDASVHGSIGIDLLKLLITPRSMKEMRALIEGISEAHPQWSIPHYLLGRLSIAEGALERGMASIETALKIGLPHIGLIYESERLTASSLFLSGAYLEAAQRYHSLAEREDLEIERGERETLYKWGRRALFFAENMPQPEPELDLVNPDH